MAHPHNLTRYVAQGPQICPANPEPAPKPVVLAEKPASAEATNPVEEGVQEDVS